MSSADRMVGMDHSEVRYFSRYVFVKTVRVDDPVLTRVAIAMIIMVFYPLAVFPLRFKLLTGELGVTRHS
jgi:hypothetical protein